MQRLFLNAERKSIIVEIPIHAFAPLLLAAGVLASSNTFAGPQRLECTLTETDAESAVEHRSITIVFDEDAATMKLRSGHDDRRIQIVLEGGIANVSEEFRAHGIWHLCTQWSAAVYSARNPVIGEYHARCR